MTAEITRLRPITRQKRDQRRMYPFDNLLFQIEKLENLQLRTSARVYQAQYGLSMPEMRVLYIAGFLQPVSGQDIAESSGTDKGLVSRAVTELEAKGHVQRSKDPLDSRRTVTQLTPSGMSLFHSIVTSKDERYSYLVETLSNAEIDTLSYLLKELQARMETIESLYMPAKPKAEILSAPKKPRASIKKPSARSHSPSRMRVIRDRKRPSAR